jgi:hypothetical protein
MSRKMHIVCTCVCPSNFPITANPFADQESAGREGIAEIVNAHIIQSGSLRSST